MEYLKKQLETINNHLGSCLAARAAGNINKLESEAKALKVEVEQLCELLGI